MNIIRLGCVDSTNRYALEKLDSLSDRDCIVADTQSNGHGRVNRKWVSREPGNIYLTIVLKPPSNSTSCLPNISQYLSVVLCDLISTYDVRPAIKWPNDVLVSGKKVAGLLAESSAQAGTLRGMVLGIGINIRMSRQLLDTIDQPATALCHECQEAPDCEEILQDLLQRFFADYDRFLQTGFSMIYDRYVSWCNFLGKKVAVTLQDGGQQGLAESILPDGQLQLRLADGQTTQVNIGDMSISA